MLVVFVVALIVLGPDKMPDAVRKGARLLGEARQWGAQISEDLQSVVSVQTHDLSPPAPETPTALPGPAAGDNNEPGAADRGPAPSANGPVDRDRPPPVPEEHHL
jgi:Sec-independent protein translocase protein TatA